MQKYGPSPPKLEQIMAILIFDQFCLFIEKKNLSIFKMLTAVTL